MDDPYASTLAHDLFRAVSHNILNNVLDNVRGPCGRALSDDLNIVTDVRVSYGSVRYDVVCYSVYDESKCDNYGSDDIVSDNIDTDV